MFGYHLGLFANSVQEHELRYDKIALDLAKVTLTWLLNIKCLDITLGYLPILSKNMN